MKNVIKQTWTVIKAVTEVTFNVVTSLWWNLI